MLFLSAFSPPRSAHRIDANKAGAPPGIEREAAPEPIPRVRHQFPVQRIHMHVMQLFDELFPAPDVEIIKPRLPEMG